MKKPPDLKRNIIYLTIAATPASLLWIFIVIWAAKIDYYFPEDSRVGFVLIYNNGLYVLSLALHNRVIRIYIKTKHPWMKLLLYWNILIVCLCFLTTLFNFLIGAILLLLPLSPISVPAYIMSVLTMHRDVPPQPPSQPLAIVEKTNDAV